MYVLTII